MRPSEVRAAGALVADAFAGTVGVVEQMHKTIAERSFRGMGPPGRTARAVHFGIADGVYTSVRGIGSATARVGVSALAALIPPGSPSVASRRGGSIALGVLNGAMGDALARKQSDLCLSMSLRRDGREVSLDPAHLAETFTDARSKIAVFIHGLCETDDAWSLLGNRRNGQASYPARLEQELGYASFTLRYNTGLHVSENGERLARLLEELVCGWPTQVTEITLVGHSMGGLVARSASYYGQKSASSWVGSLSHVVCLGSPHLGAPLEKSANVAGWALARVEETRPFARLVNGRSVGIKDLRYGSCVADDWQGHNPDELLTDRCCEIPFVDGANYYFVAATVTADPDNAAGLLVGDLLVRPSSASGEGRSRRIGFEIENGRHLGGLTHFSLLNDPAVYEQLRVWLQKART